MEALNRLSSGHSNSSNILWSLEPFQDSSFQRQEIQVWWRWYYYLCPVAWTLYGLLGSQYGDIQDQLEKNATVEQFIRSYFGYRHEFVGYIAVILPGIAVLFGFISAFSIKAFNFQQR